MHRMPAFLGHPPDLGDQPVLITKFDMTEDVAGQYRIEISVRKRQVVAEIEGRRLIVDLRGELDAGRIEIEAEQLARLAVTPQRLSKRRRTATQIQDPGSPDVACEEAGSAKLKVKMVLRIRQPIYRAARSQEFTGIELFRLDTEGLVSYMVEVFHNK